MIERPKPHRRLGMVWCSFPAGDRRCGSAAQQAEYPRYGLGGGAAGAETLGPYIVRIIRKAKNRLADEIFEIFFQGCVIFLIFD